MKQVLIVALATLALNSCLDSETSFRIIGNVLLFQEVTVTPSGETDEDTVYNYVPYVLVESSDAMLSCSCIHSSIGNFNLSKLDDWHWHSSYPTGERTASIPTGSFTITATSTSQKVDSSVIYVTTATAGMINRLESTLEYDSTTREVTANFNAVTGATLYGVALVRGEYFWIGELRTYTAEQLQAENGSVQVVLPEAIDGYAEGDFYLVTYAASIADVPVVQLGARIRVTK